MQAKAAGDLLSRVPAWNQLYDPEPSGAGDAFASEDCGEEVAAMMEWAWSGVAVTEGHVRRSMPGHSTFGNTTPGDIAGYLRSIDIPATVGSPLASAVWGYLVEQVRRGRPVAVLGYFVAPTVLHWVVVTGSAAGQIQFHDPWGGSIRWVPGAWFVKRYGGATVEYDLPLGPMG